MSLVVQHDNEGIDIALMKHGIGAEWSRNANAVGRRLRNRRTDDLDLFATEQTTLAGMRIDAAHADTRDRDAEPLEGRIGDADRPLDPLPRDQCNGVAHAEMEGAVDDARRAEAQHEKHVVRRKPGLARHERRITIERDARERDRRLVLRRRHDSVNVAGERRPDRRACARQRCLAGRRADAAERKVGEVRPPTGQHVDHAARPVSLRHAIDQPPLMGNLARLRLPIDDVRIADHNGAANPPHRSRERRL